MFSYIFSGETHIDTTPEFMASLGMNDEQISSTLQQMEFESSQSTVKRQAAYAKESDPLYIEWQYELATENPDADSYKQLWLDKMSNIKSRYPLVAV
ncbi:hypothetical protein [Shewanella sp. YLB-07]|uniref:hypothetical protein n=1 Tax=Shewanella sp. YLB-07 TaxID=2601268 RepID=UPI00128E05DE|nr:hypothetical protein [Shewanella sp. YLB-07]MPY25188.1 hypothetical protein [Shewanella sp. YLB-07]